MQQAESNQTTSSTIMATPPQIISTKDAMYLRDELSWLLLASKKAAHFAKQCTDPEVKQTIDSIGKLHQQHYSLLQKHLSHDNDNALAKIPQASQPQ